LKEAQFPALFERAGAQLLATLYQLEQSQWWTPDELREAQARQLVVLLQHAREHVPYYRQAFEKMPVMDDAEALLKGWSRLPLLTRSDITRAGPDLYTTASLPLHGRQRKISTSGSTGKPMHSISNELVTHFYRSIACREVIWSRRDFTRKFCAIRPDKEHNPDGADRENWGRPLSLVYETGPAALLYSTASIEYQVDWLLEQKPAYLLSMPSNFQGLVEEFDKRGERLESLEQAISFAETLSPQRRALIEGFFGVPVKDLYSSVEAGYIAVQCPDHAHLHVQSEAILVEVLDEDGQSCKPGEIGRVVLTPLHNFSAPLIRYVNGDYVEVGDTCPCGRGLPVIRQVMGRERNLLTMPDGSRHWPYLSIGDWDEIAPIRQAQVVQKTRDRLEIRLAAERQLTAQEKDELEKYITKQLRHAFQYEITYHDSLTRGRNFKFEDFISELK
jgi:phenylacetate-CoA ligase